MKKFTVILSALPLLTACDDSGDFGTLFFIALLLTVIIIVIIATVAKGDSDNTIAKITREFDDLKDFTVSSKVEGFTAFESFLLAIDNLHDEIYYSTRNASYRIPFSKLISADICEDGQVTVSKKSTLGTLGGAVVGGVLAGGVGAIVGGNNLGKTTSVSSVSSLSVHILIRDFEISVLDIKLLGFSVKTTSEFYKDAAKSAKEIMDLITVAIDKADHYPKNPDKQTTEEQKTSPGKDNIEKLKDLADLKEKGIITDEELSAMKKKILES